MIDCANSKCPAYEKCDAPSYRGSRCAYLRWSYGLGDPMTNGDKVRAMTDEEISEWFWWMLDYSKCYTDSRIALSDWLKQEV